MGIGRFNVAAEIYESIGDNENAVDCYIRANMHDRALEVAQMVTPPNVRDKMIKDIQNLKRQAMLNDGRAEDLLKRGDVSGLE